ncbi:MAG TPA: hypothetical protein VMW18_14905 [Candidatus Binatia bacterium]|nr:hypothetical protein [Candidatus Binatia bacterium]
MAERAEDALSRRRRGEQVGRAGLGEQVLKLRGAAGGLVAERANQPAATSGENGAAGRRQRADGASGDAAGRGERPGGEAGHQALEAAGGAVEAAPERDDEGDQPGLAEKAARDESGNGGEDEADPAGEVGGKERGRERERRGCHGKCS